MNPANESCRFWWVKLRALVEVRDWETLEKLAKSKKSPIGYEVCTHIEMFVYI